MPRTRQKQLRTCTHTSPIHQCDDDLLIIAPRGQCREAGAQPDSAFQMLLGKQWAVSYLSAAYRAKAVTAKTPRRQHKADLGSQTSVSQLSGCRMQEKQLEEAWECHSLAVFFRTHRSHCISSNFSTVQARLLDRFNNTNTDQIYHIITFVRSHKSVQPHHQGLHRCVKMQPNWLTDWLGCVNFRGGTFGSSCEMRSSGSACEQHTYTHAYITNLPIHTGGGWMGRVLPARNTLTVLLSAPGFRGKCVIHQTTARLTMTHKAMYY